MFPKAQGLGGLKAREAPRFGRPHGLLGPKFRGLTANAAGPLKRRFAPKKRRFAPALLGPKGSPFRPKIKENMKNEKVSKTVREKRF